MKRIILAVCLGLISMSMAAQSEGMLLRHTEVIGDAMGESTGITQWNKPLYDKNGNILREVVYGRGLTEIIELVRYTTNILNDKGQKVESSSQQYGIFDGEDMGFHASQDTTIYEYDARGNLISEETQYYQRIEYIYDEQDNCIKKIRYNYTHLTGEWAESEVTEYSEFLPGFTNKPTKIDNTGRWDSYIYVGEIAYDEAGRKISEKHYNNWHRMKLVGNSYYWTYDDGGFLTLHEKKYVNDGGVEENYRRTNYIKQTGTAPGVERIEQHSQNYYTDGKWYNDPTYLISEYTYYDHAKYAPEITVTQDNEKNIITVVTTLPEQAAADGDRAALKILDNGVVMDIVTVAQARAKGMLSADGKTVTWTSETCRNGHHEMVVQYVQANDENPTTDTTTDWNISNAVGVDMNKWLPAPGNIRGVVAEKDKYGDYNLTVEWDAAEDAEAYGIQKYNVIISGYSIADNNEDPGKGMSLTWKFKGLRDAVTFMVQAVYPYGKANSEYVTLNPKDYLPVVTDTRICVEEERTWIDGSRKEVRKYFVDKTDKVVRSNLCSSNENEDEDEYENENGLVLESYAKWEYSSEEKPATITVTSNDNVQVRACTYDENGRLAEYSYDAEEEDAKYQYTVSFTYDGEGRLDTEIVKQAKYKSSGALGNTKTLSQTKYTNDPNDENIVNGVYSEYNSLNARWTEVASVKRYMMPAKSIYAPTAEVKANTLDGLTISVKPSAETMAGVSAFNIYRDGEMIAQGVSLFDEEHVVETEYGEFVEWLFKDEYQGAGKVCEYIVQYATLDNYMNYDRAYSIAEPLTVDFSQATRISHPTPEGVASEGIYNLAGQKVQRGYKGIVIIKGRKSLTP